jgi:DNA segregation ATPase FtsK/SpoIIIE-like protein
MADQERDLYREAMTVVKNQEWITVGLIQRELQIAYFTAAALIERLEDEAIVGPPVPGHLGQQRVLNRQRSN